MPKRDAGRPGTPYGPCAPHSNADQINGERVDDMVDGYPAFYPIEKRSDGLSYAAGPPALYYDGQNFPGGVEEINDYKKNLENQYKGEEVGGVYTGSINPWDMTAANWACYQNHALGDESGEIFNSDPNPALSHFQPGDLSSTPEECEPFDEWIDE